MDRPLITRSSGVRNIGKGKFFTPRRNGNQTENKQKWWRMDRTKYIRGYHSWAYWYDHDDSETPVHNTHSTGQQLKQTKLAKLKIQNKSCLHRNFLMAYLRMS